LKENKAWTKLHTPNLSANKIKIANKGAFNNKDDPGKNLIV